MTMRDALKRQYAAEDFLPDYRHHVSDTCVTLGDGSIFFAFRLAGAPFETAQPAILESQYDALNNAILAMTKTVGARLAA